MRRTSASLVLLTATLLASLVPAAGAPAISQGVSAAASVVSVGTAVQSPTSIAPTAIPGRPRLLRRLRCSAWTFVPLSTTRCTKGTLDTVRVITYAGRYYAWSTTRRTWVVIGYSWNRTLGRLELDARKLSVPQPTVGVATKVWRWTCARWTLVTPSGPTTCTSGTAQRVLARFAAPGAPAALYDLATARFHPSYYRWNPRGGYLSLDATLIPAPPTPTPAPPPPAPAPPVAPQPEAGVDLGATMQPRGDPTAQDVVVRCDSGSVTATIAATGGASVTFAGVPYTAPAVVTVPLSAGQRLSWTLQLPGAAPVDQQARCLPADFPTFTAARTGTPVSQWYLFTPALGIAGAPIGPTKYVVMADDHGIPVWWKGISGYAPLDAKLLPSGELAWGETGYTFSFVNVLHRSDWSGNETGTIGLGLGLDHHDVVPTSDGNYLGIRYVFRDCPATPSECVDMTSVGGSAAATLIDGELVKFTPAGDVLWTWRARDHLSLSEWTDLTTPRHASLARLDIGGRDNWDIDHINSVAEDGDGLIVSFRHLDAIYRIRESDGSIDWKLGGTPTARSLTVLGLDRAPLVASQHDARLLPNGHLSVFDNGTDVGAAPRVLEIAIDPVARVASVVRQTTDPRVPASPCCGSAREVSSGGWVTSWGGTGLITETDGTGRPVLSIRFDSATSYRVVPVEPGRVSRSTLEAGMDAMYPTTP